MSVVVTGGAGFIGSSLVPRLLADGHQVYVVDDLFRGSEQNLHEPLRNPACRLEKMDITSPAFGPWLRSVAPSRVFHLAANSDVRLGGADVRLDVQRTLMTTVAVLEAMPAAGCRELVFTSSSTIYGEPAGLVDEEHTGIRPISFYGAAKLSSEAYVAAHAHLHGLQAWVFRLPNVVGPRLTHGVVYDFFKRLTADPAQLRIMGNGRQTKSYLHVDDALDAIWVALRHPAATWNVAGRGVTTVMEVAHLVRQALELDSPVECEDSDRGWPGDVRQCAMDGGRLAALGWQASMTSSEAVSAAVAWARAHGGSVRG